MKPIKTIRYNGIKNHIILALLAVGMGQAPRVDAMRYQIDPQTELCNAVSENEHDNASYWLQKGAKPNMSCTPLEQTPLFLARDVQMAQILLNGGALPNKQDSEGSTPLSKHSREFVLGGEKKDYDLVQLLINDNRTNVQSGLNALLGPIFGEMLDRHLPKRQKLNKTHKQILARIATLTVDFVTHGAVAFRDDKSYQNESYRTALLYLSPEYPSLTQSIMSAQRKYQDEHAIEENPVAAEAKPIEAAPVTKKRAKSTPAAQISAIEPTISAADKDLAKAVVRNNPDAVKAALGQTPNVNVASTWRGTTPLWEACTNYINAKTEETENNADRIITYLLQLGADVDVSYATLPKKNEGLLDNVLSQLLWKPDKERKNRIQKLALRLINAGAQPPSPEIAEKLAKKQPEVSDAITQALTEREHRTAQHTRQPEIDPAEREQEQKQVQEETQILVQEPVIYIAPVAAAAPSPSQPRGRRRGIERFRGPSRAAEPVAQAAAVSAPRQLAPTRRRQRSILTPQPFAQTPGEVPTFIHPGKRESPKAADLRAELGQLSLRVNYLNNAISTVQQDSKSSLENRPLPKLIL